MKYIILFFSLFSSIIFYFYFSKYIKIEKPMYLFDQVDADFPSVNLFKPNFKGKCGKIFKYKSNNKRDLVIFAYDFFNKKNNIWDHLLFMEYGIKNVLESFKYSIPFAHIICFVSKKSKETKVFSILKEFNVEIIEINDSSAHIVNRRFLETYIYLNKNKEKYDRVLFADMNDIYLFGDIFATIKKDDFYINKLNYYHNVPNKECVNFMNSSSWKISYIKNLKKEKSLLIYKEFEKNVECILCAGLFIGGIEKSLNFFKIFSQALLDYAFNKTTIQMNNFGYDQLMLNFLYYTKKFEKLKIKVIGCEQIFCTRPKNLLFNKDTTRFYFETDNCSPILIHKNYPNSWISRKHKKLKNFNSY